YLVVEGVINSGSDSTFIKLSHTVKLDSKTYVPDSEATVTIESDKNDKYALSEVKTGIYSTVNLNLPTDRKYRLHIVTAKGREYVSDFVENKITPAIDSVFYQPLTSGVQFYVSSHDPSNKTRYYRWDYDETWSYFSLERSQLTYKNHVVSFTDPDSLLSTCYRHATPSNSFYVSNSINLSQDVIARFPIGYVAASSGRLTHVYSVNVKQYAITADAYKFWQILKKNTEQLGSIFDPYPSTSIGNIHPVNNPADLAIGFVSVSTVTSKRIILSGRTLPFHVPVYVGPPYVEDCKGGYIPVDPVSTLPYRLQRTLGSGDSIPTFAHENSAHQIDGYSYSEKLCVDCKVVGGTTIRPAYWPIGF
ncbi:MAG: DUF4249 domain-containing protein, partial [Sphingobacteriales bacterium]